VGRVGGETEVARRREVSGARDQVAVARRRAPSAPESYTAAEYRSWASQRHQRSPSAPSHRRSGAPTAAAAAADRRRLTASRRLADGETQPVQRVPTRTSTAARPRQPVASVSSGKDATLTKKPLKIRTEDFRPYRTSPQLLRQHQLRQRQRRIEDEEKSRLNGMLSVHVYCGHGLRATPTTLRDLYCVVGVDGLNRARTAVQTGAINFDWDETFDIDVLDAEAVSFGIYSWASTGGTTASASKQKLFFSGTVHLREYLQRGGPHQQLALRLDPTGVLYVELEYLDVSYVYRRSSAPQSTGRFGVALESLVLRERSPGNVPVVVRRCAEEVERRGLECVGIYRLCCSSRRKRMLKADMDADAETAVLTAERIPDVNVVSCK